MSWKSLLGLGFVTLLAAAGAARAQDPAGTDTAERERTLRVGESLRVAVDFPIGDVSSGQGQRYFTIANPPRESGEPLPEVVIVGREAGRDSLVIYDDSGTARRRITVVVIQPTSMDKCAEDLQAMLADVPQVSVKALHTRVLVDGTALTPDVRERVRKITDSYAETGECLVLVLLDRSALYEREVERAVNEELLAMGIRSVQARVRNHRLYLRGAVTAETEATLATQLAQSYYPDVVNMLVITPPMTAAAAAVQVRQALRQAGYDLFVFAKGGRIYVEGVAKTASDKDTVRDIAQEHAGPHAGSVVVRLVGEQ